MNSNDIGRFADIMQGLAEDKGIQLSGSGIELKFAALKQYSIEEIHNAAIQMLGNKKYATMPSVSDFVEYLGGGSIDDRAEVESSKVWKAIISVGGYSSVAFDDPVTQAVILHAFGGWSKLCEETMSDNQKWFVKDFAKYYGAYSRQGLKVFGLLSGRGGLSGDKTKLIGNPEKALLIMNTVQKESRFQITQSTERVTNLIYQVLGEDK